MDTTVVTETSITEVYKNAMKALSDERLAYDLRQQIKRANLILAEIRHRNISYAVSVSGGGREIKLDYIKKTTPL